jgi:internalin A
VKGTDPGARRRLLAIVRYDLDKINGEFKDRLDVQLKVPLPMFPQFAVDYNKLVALEKLGVHEFPELVDNDIVTVHVRDALSGVELETKQKDGTVAQTSRLRSIFISYSHKDEILCDELETHLKLLVRQEVISLWHDRKILGGEEWDGVIDQRLRTSEVILLLVSSDFIASDYCWGEEVKVALERHEFGEATVVPVMLRTCDWKRAPFAKIQGLPRDMKPVTAWEDRDAAWTNVARGIREVVEKSSSQPLDDK